MNRRVTRWLSPGLIPAAMLLVAGILSLWAQIYILPGDVEAADWKAPAAWVQHHAGPNDAVNVQPNWTEAPYPYLTTVGDQIARQDQPLAEDVWDRDHLWVLAETDRLDRALTRMPYPAATTKSFGEVTVARIDPPTPGRITYGLRGHLDTARVRHLDASGSPVATCQNWDKEQKAWYCGRPDKWVYVGHELVDIGGDPHRCIWAHPPDKRHRVELTFPDVPLAQTFRLRAGLNQRGARSKRGKPVHIRLRVGPKQVAEHTIPARQSSWKPIDLDTSEVAGRRADVTIEVWSESVFDRLFCLNGWVLNS